MEYTAIITTILTRQNLLSQAMMSVVKQQLAARQIIVVIDRAPNSREADITKENLSLSKQLSSELLDEHNISFIKNTGKGISAARNTGIAKAKSEWVAFLDDDDRWLPDKMIEQAKLIEEANGDNSVSDVPYPICHSDEMWLCNGTELKQLSKHRKQGGKIYPNCLELCCISPSAVVLHKSIFTKHGLFDENMPVCEDYDMWLRICAYEEVLFLDKPLVIKNGGHKGQLSKRYWGMDRFRIYAAQKMLHDDNLPAVYREMTTDSIKQRLEILANGADKRNKHLFCNYYKTLLSHLGEPLMRKIYYPTTNS